VNTYHAAGFAVVVQDVIIGDALTEYTNLIHARPLIVVVLIPQIEIVASREAHRDKASYRESFDGIAELDAALRHETPRLGMWLDTSDQTPQETVDEIVARGHEEAIVV
jgi:chloramphenicol 3-O-phosphotransferase